MYALRIMELGNPKLEKHILSSNFLPKSRFLVLEFLKLYITRQHCHVRLKLRHLQLCIGRKIMKLLIMIQRFKFLILHWQMK